MRLVLCFTIPFILTDKAKRFSRFISRGPGEKIAGI